MVPPTRGRGPAIPRARRGRVRGTVPQTCLVPLPRARRGQVPGTLPQTRPIRRGAGPLSAAPALGRGHPAVALRPVVALLDDEAVAVEAKPRHPGERDLIAALDQCRPPLDRGPVAV